MIHLEFLTTDPDEISIAKRYWSVENDGKFTYRVNSLLPWRSVRTANQLSTTLRATVIATDVNQRCPQCDRPEVLTARSQFVPRAFAPRYPCSKCKETALASKREADAAVENALKRQLDILTERSLAKRLQIDTISDTSAMLLLALDTAISPRLANSTFTEKDCKFMAPHGVEGFITKLVQQDILIFRPDISPPGSFASRENQISYYPSKIIYQMTQPSSDLTRAAALTSIRQREFRPSVALAELWLDHACSECLRYVHDQAELHNLPIDNDLHLQISSVIRVAAKTYSVSEIWSLLWKVVRDAASLSRRDYYSPSKAAATLPNKVKRQIERVNKGEVVVKPWSRPDHQPTGTLGELFSEIFGIDEDVSGHIAMEILSQPVASTSAPSSSTSPMERVHADRLFLAASGHGVALEVLEAFSEATGMGYSQSDAISYVYEIHPFLNDPY